MLGLTVGIGTALVYAGYNCMAPRSQLFGRTFIGNGPQSRDLSLTFDDGPNDPCTFRLLEILSKYEIKATFFCIGRYVDQRPDIVREVIAQGHVVANHTYTHPNLIFQSQRETREELDRCNQALTNAVGDRHLKLFRPPFGARRPATLRTIRKAGYEPIMWNVTAYDWRAKTADEIERNVYRQVRGGDVVLLHDGGHLEFGADRSRTVEATRRIIVRYREEGYTFVTVPRMMSAG